MPHDTKPFARAGKVDPATRFKLRPLAHALGEFNRLLVDAMRTHRHVRIDVQRNDEEHPALKVRLDDTWVLVELPCELVHGHTCEKIGKPRELEDDGSLALEVVYTDADVHQECYAHGLTA